MIKQIYQDPSNPAGFGSPIRVWERAVKRDPTITLGEVRTVLQDIDAYTLHRRVRRVKSTRKYLSPGLNRYFQIDLFVLNDFMARVNSKRYILFCIDAFSRKLFARALNRKTGKEVVQALKSIFRENNNIAPGKIVSDKGTEWLNAEVQSLFRSRNIVHITTENVYHAGLVERVIRTMREKIGRYMTHFNTNVFMTKLNDFVKAYNEKPHASLPKGVSPSDVTPRNETDVWKYQFARYFRRAPGFYGPARLRVGQVVRITAFRGTFAKSSEATFTEEKFIITHVLETEPRTYKVASLSKGDVILGAFYRNELQPVTP